MSGISSEQRSCLEKGSPLKAPLSPKVLFTLSASFDKECLPQVRFLEAL